MNKRHTALLIDMLTDEIKQLKIKVNQASRDSTIIKNLKKQLTDAGIEPEEIPLSFSPGSVNLFDLADTVYRVTSPFYFRGPVPTEKTPYDSLWSKQP